MSGFSEMLRLKERAEENIYFAKRDLELIRALHERELAGTVQARGKKQKMLARSFEKKIPQADQDPSRETQETAQGLSQAHPEDPYGVRAERAQEEILTTG